MIEFKDIKANAEKAYNNDELYEFIMGRNGYQLRVIDAPVDVPTDWTRIIPNGIYAVYQELEDGNVVYKYEQAIIKAINGTCQDLWCAINILYFQIDHEKMNKSPFFIDKTILKQHIQYMSKIRVHMMHVPILLSHCRKFDQCFH